jgi:transcriptional regulator with XRE-family HTH domain
LTDGIDGPTDEPTAHRRRLAAMLRDLRLAGGLDQTTFAARAGGMSQSKVSRLELARQVPTLAEARAWAGAAGADADATARLLELTEAALTELTSKQEELRSGLAALQQRIGRTEQAVSMVREYTVVVPGLLQTAEYARRVFTCGEGLVPGVVRDIPAAVTARLERQQVLYEPGKRFEFVVREAALRWRPGPDGARVVAAQLDRVAALSTLESVTFGVIPWSADVYSTTPHEFAILGDPETDEDVQVEIETTTRIIHIRDAAQIAVYLELWRRLSADAVFGDDARALLHALVRELRGGLRTTPPGRPH